MTPPYGGTGPEQPEAQHAHHPKVTHDLGFDLPAPASVSKTRGTAIALVVAAVLAVAFVLGYLPRLRERAALETDTKTNDHAALRVTTMTPTERASDHALQIPGSVQPLEETIVYARANGYVRKWYRDIGDKVKDQETLADIETPELDQELDQARAQLLQAQAGLLQSNANRDLSKANLERYKALIPSGVVSQADLDQRNAQWLVDDANVKVSQANGAAQEANIRRLTRLKEFARVVAPFGGVVTQRWVEIGALVTAGNATPLYKVAAMDPARVFIQVPQDVAPSVRPDVAVKVSVREYAGRVFDGKVTRSADELDPATRTMTTEVRIPNPDGALIAGMYADVALVLPSPHRVYEIPASALYTDSKGARVATVDADSKIHFVPVVVERDTGSVIEIASGIGPDTHVVKLASAGLSEGKIVESLN